MVAFALDAVSLSLKSQASGRNQLYILRQPNSDTKINLEGTFWDLPTNGQVSELWSRTWLSLELTWVLANILIDISWETLTKNHPAITGVAAKALAAQAVGVWTMSTDGGEWLGRTWLCCDHMNC